MEKTSVIVIFYVYLKFSLNFSYIFLDADELSQDIHNVNHCIFHTEQIQIL